MDWCGGKLCLQNNKITASIPLILTAFANSSIIVLQKMVDITQYPRQLSELVLFLGTKAGGTDLQVVPSKIP